MTCIYHRYFFLIRLFDIFSILIFPDCPNWLWPNTLFSFVFEMNLNTKRSINIIKCVIWSITNKRSLYSASLQLLTSPSETSAPHLSFKTMECCKLDITCCDKCRYGENNWKSFPKHSTFHLFLRVLLQVHAWPSSVNKEGWRFAALWDSEPEKWVA